MLVCSLEVGNRCLGLTEATVLGTESPQVPSPHCCCSNPSSECFWGNKRRMKSTRGCSHAVVGWCLYHHSGERPDGTACQSNSTLTLFRSTLTPLPDWSDDVRKGKKKKEGSLWDKLWLNVSESNRWADFELVKMDGMYDRPHMQSLSPFPITSYIFGFTLCLSCHNPKKTAWSQTLLSPNKPHFRIPLHSPLSLSSSLWLHFCFLVRISVSHRPGSVSKRAEPFHKLVNSSSEQKVTEQSGAPGTGPTQMLPTLKTSANLSAQWASNQRGR